MEVRVRVICERVKLRDVDFRRPAGRVSWVRNQARQVVSDLEK